MRPARRLDGLGVTLIRRFLRDAPPGAINMALGMTNSDVPPSISDALISAASRHRAPYGPNAGRQDLRDLIAGRAGVKSERVIVTAGVQQGIALTILGVIDEGDEVLCPDPGFPVYANIARIAGGVARPYSLQGPHFRPTLKAIESAITARTKLVVLCSPGNPTGAVADPEAWRDIGSALANREILTMSDEVYLELQHGEPHPSMLAHHPDAIVLGGLAKSHGIAGWRLGWLISPPPLVDALSALHQHLVTSASTLVQEAACAAFTAQGDAEVRALREHLGRMRTLAVEALEGTGWVVCAGDGAFYLWVRRPGFEDDLELAKQPEILTRPKSIVSKSEVRDVMKT